MIQRIQSIFLLLASICNFSLFIKPMALANAEAESAATIPAFADHALYAQENPVTMAIAIIAGLLALVIIFLFKNRQLQMRLSQFLILTVLTLLGVVLFLFYQNYSIVHPIPGFGLGSIVLAFVFIYLAIINIRKDDKLVKSMDRLR